MYSYWNTYGIPVVILRPFNNLGPRQHLEKLIPRFITACILGENMVVHGDGSASRDWVYVDDTCRAIDIAMHCDLGKVQGEVINIGTGKSTSILEIADGVLARMNCDRGLVTFTEDRPGQVLRHTASTKKAAELLGWRAEVDFWDGLDRTIQWYKDNREWWERLIWMRSVQITTKDGKKIIH